MNLEAHRAMRREQIERWLAAEGMGVAEWCRLNLMATSTSYLWLNRFREEEPEVFGERPAKGWIEVAKQAKKDSVALEFKFIHSTLGCMTPVEFRKAGLILPLRRSVQILGYLMMKFHERHGKKGGEAHCFEHAVCKSGKNHVGLLRVANLVMTQFEPDGVPGRAVVAEFQGEGAHDVCCGDVFRARGIFGDDSAGEPFPA